MARAKLVPIDVVRPQESGTASWDWLIRRPSLAANRARQKRSPLTAVNPLILQHVVAAAAAQPTLQPTLYPLFLSLFSRVKWSLGVIGVGERKISKQKTL